jgi:hypothetical protein
MRAALVLLIGVIAASPVAAETRRLPATERSPAVKTLPLKGAGRANPCATYGPGFVQVEGTGSCVKLGGTLDVGVSTSIRR